MRITYLLLCLVLLSGCTSTLLTAISAADIVSGITTGKTSTDNAVSAAIGKDCVLHRFFKSEKICTDKLLDKMEKCLVITGNLLKRTSRIVNQQKT